MHGTLKELAQELQAARKTKGWSQRDLSARLHMPQAHLSRIERGMVDPKLSTLIELARMLERERMLERDLMLVPRRKLNLVQAILKSPDDATHRRPVYALEDEE